jgi:hypothetical protein
MGELIANNVNGATGGAFMITIASTKIAILEMDPLEAMASANNLTVKFDHCTRIVPPLPPRALRGSARLSTDSSGDLQLLITRHLISALRGKLAAGQATRPASRICILLKLFDLSNARALGQILRDVRQVWLPEDEILGEKIRCLL